MTQAVTMTGPAPMAVAIASASEEAASPGFSALLAAVAPAALGGFSGVVPPARWSDSLAPGVAPLAGRLPVTRPSAAPALPLAVSQAGSPLAEAIVAPSEATAARALPAALLRPGATTTMPVAAPRTARESALPAVDRRAEAPDADDQSQALPDTGPVEAEFAGDAGQPSMPAAPLPAPIVGNEPRAARRQGDVLIETRLAVAKPGAAIVTPEQPVRTELDHDMPIALPGTRTAPAPIPAEAPKPGATAPPANASPSAKAAPPADGLPGAKRDRDLGRPAPVMPLPAPVTPSPAPTPVLSAPATPLSARAAPLSAPAAPLSVQAAPLLALALTVSASPVQGVTRLPTTAVFTPPVGGQANGIAPAPPPARSPWSLEAAGHSPASPVARVVAEAPDPARLPGHAEASLPLPSSAAAAAPAVPTSLAVHSPPAAHTPAMAGVTASPLRRGEPRDASLPALLERDDPGIPLPAAPLVALARPTPNGVVAPAEVQAAPAATAPPASPIDIALSSSRLGDVRIGIEGAADDLRVSIGLSPAAASIVAADAPRLIADLAATGIRLQALDLSGAGVPSQGYAGNGTGQSPQQHSPQPPPHPQHAQPYPGAVRPAATEPAHPRTSDRYA